MKTYSSGAPDSEPEQRNGIVLRQKEQKIRRRGSSLITYWFSPFPSLRRDGGHIIHATMLRCLGLSGGFAQTVSLMFLLHICPSRESRKRVSVLKYGE
jgi:hypothetical protein